MISGSKRKLCKAIQASAVCGLLMAVTGMMSACTPRNSGALIVGETAVCAGTEAVSGTESDNENERQSMDSTAESTVHALKETTEAAEVYVLICGAVNNPGVYVLQGDGRVCDAVSAAGGFTDEADQDYVNQACQLTDGIKITIPTSDEVKTMRDSADGGAFQGGMTQGADGISLKDAEAGTAAGGSAVTDDGRVNINTADETGLCTIPGIGRTRAADIIAYREAHGGFKTEEDIKNVTGIKEGTFEKIRDHIKVR